MDPTFNLARHVHGMALNPDQIRHGGVCRRAAWRQAMTDLWKYIKYLKSIAFDYFKNNSVHQHPFRPGSQNTQSFSTFIRWRSNNQHEIFHLVDAPASPLGSSRSDPSQGKRLCRLERSGRHCCCCRHNW